MKISLSKILLLVFGMFLLAACHKLDATTAIEPDGSGELRMEVGFSAEERATMENQNNNPQDFCNAAQPPENVTVIEEQRGDETWCINIAAFGNLDDLRSMYEQRKGITINRLEISDGMFYYDITVDMSSEDSSFSVLKEMTWSVVLPGTPVAHNADRADGNTLTWTPTPKSGIVNLLAESEAPQGTFNFPPCGSALPGIGVVFLAFKRRRFK